MFRKTILTIFASALIVCGQTDSANTVPALYPPPNQAFDELKQHLGLTDAQLEQLRKILEERTAASLEISRQIQQKYAEMNSLLQSGSRDAARIGQLMIEIHTLGTQQPPSGDQWRQRALAVLTPDQRTKLGPLDQALKLSTPGYQAVTLNLLDPPPPGRVGILAGIDSANTVTGSTIMPSGPRQ